ncbi:MAG TPA: neutral/alkaline non-lysosomal ceramidase N-terminal domain-containing protein [Pirellulaceae bacterium]|nr:neutral/alkaline non-lysosomal ceramidase N-terminal domain-containing protein [Pirellulaceae bacterium]
MIRFGMLLLTIAITTPSAAILHAADNDFRAGVAVRDITPPIGYRMSGYFYERGSTGTLDPLQAKALVLAQGDTQAALVFCDLIGLGRNVSDRARELASKETKIPASNIVIAATHSHTGPLYAGVLRDYFHAQAVAKHGHDPAEQGIDYPAVLAKQIAAAIVAAQANLQSVTLAGVQAEQRGLSFNRRFHMKDGSVRFNPGRNNPDIVRVAGPIDPELNLLTFRGKETLLATLAVFALHLDTVGGTEYSADYPHHFARLARTPKSSADELLLFGAGTCGDINHINVTQADQPKGQAMAEHIGTTLSATLRQAVEKSQTLKPQLAVRSSLVVCPLQKYESEAIAKAQANMSKVGGKELSFLDQVEACKIVALQNRPKDNLNCEVQVFRLSNSTAIVCLPGEVFVDLGLAIKAASPFEHTIVIELCNDAPGYIPTKKAFAEGSYETVNSLLAPGGGELLVEEALKLLKALYKPAA